MNLDRFARHSFTFGPSPIERLPRLSAHLGGKVEIWAKRDDCNSGIAYRRRPAEPVHQGSQHHSARSSKPAEYVQLYVPTSALACHSSKSPDPFFTTKPIAQGTGLSLSMIYGFAKHSVSRFASRPRSEGPRRCACNSRGTGAMPKQPSHARTGRCAA